MSCHSLHSLNNAVLWAMPAHTLNVQLWGAAAAPPPPPLLLVVHALCSSVRHRLCSIHSEAALAIAPNASPTADTAAVVWDKDRLLLRRESQTGM